MTRFRVFPRRTKATPDDADVRIGPPGLFDEADEIHISVTFTWDRAEAEALEKQWRYVAPVRIGGPAYDDRGGAFVPGLYLKRGYVITSRGCDNSCSFCVAWRREGRIRELRLEDGHNVLDNNLLQCSHRHVQAVFSMLKRQKSRARFTGGLQPALLSNWVAGELAWLKPEVIFLAYDKASDFEALRVAAGRLRTAGLIGGKHRVRAYVLCGYGGDTLSAAELRMTEVCALGIMPMAMLYRSEDGEVPPAEWRRFQRGWARPSIVGARMRLGCVRSWANGIS